MFVVYFCIRHSSSEEMSCLPSASRLSEVNNLPMQELQSLPENIATVIDDCNVKPSDLTITELPTASYKGVDTTVEQTCEKIKLTASNVRNIIRVSVLSQLFYVFISLSFLQAVKFVKSFQHSIRAVDLSRFCIGST